MYTTPVNKILRYNSQQILRYNSQQQVITYNIPYINKI